MNQPKKIALITNASNFERQKNIVISVHKTLKAMGGYVLYVISNYGIFPEEGPYSYAESGIYDFLDYAAFDGCIIEGNIGSHRLLDTLAAKLKKKGTPFVTINIAAPDAPFLTFSTYNAAYELTDHLTNVHKCRKINLVLTTERELISKQTLLAYKEVLKKGNIPYDSNRIVYQTVSTKNGRDLYRIFREKKIDDAQAVICVHDVLAIGLCLELESRGKKVPDDMLLCSLNRSMNSAVFRPEITGADRMDARLAERACYLVTELMNGGNVPIENYETAVIHYGESCGCKKILSSDSAKWYQQLIVSKVEAGGQISQIMQFNDALETVDSLDELGENIRHMLLGIQCKEFFCCINQGDMKYIINDSAYQPLPKEKPFDDTMVALTGTAKRCGILHRHAFPLNEIAPVKGEDGDIFILYPLHHKDILHGYMVFLNEYFPVEVYNYRICHEGICSSMENLHRQMILRSSIKELDELHMRDQMTGLYNRFAISRFSEDFVNSGEFSIAMIDMDGLKTINDNYGHLSGNHAICNTADAILETASKSDLVVRYGGDEFQIISRNLDPDYWETLHAQINTLLAEKTVQQKLPYHLGISLGFAISTAAKPLAYAQSFEIADRAMYENKKLRKKERK